MYSQLDEALVTKNLLVAMGFQLTPEGNIVDQETRSQIAFENTALKANDNPNVPLYISKYDTRLEPLNPLNTKILERLFALFTEKEIEYGNIPEINGYYCDKNTEILDDDLYQLVVKFSDGTKMKSDWFRNKGLCYLQSIFVIDGTFIDLDLHRYDSEKE